MERWDPQYLDQMGYEIWKDLSETHMPGISPDKNLLMMLDTIRYLLWCTDNQKNWRSGIFDKERIMKFSWDENHIHVYQKN